MNFQDRIIALTGQQILLSTQLAELKERIQSSSYDCRSRKSLKRDYHEVKKNLMHTEHSIEVNKMLGGK